MSAKSLTIDCWLAAVESVKGEIATNRALDALTIPKIDRVLAVGKASVSMFKGALSYLNAQTQSLIITKHGHVDMEAPEGAEIIESAHPIPDQSSLAAGAKALSFIESASADETLIVLVSGGASSLVEVLPDSIGLREWSGITELLLAKGYNINQINAVRTRFSQIKGGKLLQRFKGKSIISLAISDVPMDDIGVIGSGIGNYTSVNPIIPGQIKESLPNEISELLGKMETDSCYLNDRSAGKNQVNYSAHIIGSNRTARNAARDWAVNNNLVVRVNEESLHQDVEDAADMISKTLLGGEDGMYIWGGEPTVILPQNPGKGGRNQHLALLLAKRLQETEGVDLIVAGTDGTDGPTDAAGGIVNGDTFNAVSEAESALANADSGSFLERAGALFVPGPTGTNVMDLVIAVKK